MYIHDFFLLSQIYLFSPCKWLFHKKKINFEDQYMVHIAVLKKNRFNDY